MTRDRDDEPTVKVRRSSVSPKGVFSDRDNKETPDPHKAYSEIETLDRAWRNYCAGLLRTSEGQRHTIGALREENQALRDAMDLLRGPR